MFCNVFTLKVPPRTLRFRTRLRCRHSGTQLGGVGVCLFRLLIRLPHLQMWPLGSVFWVYDVFVYSNMLCDILCGKELLKINFPDTSKQNTKGERRERAAEFWLMYNRCSCCSNIKRSLNAITNSFSGIVHSVNGASIGTEVIK
ncbi:hypothetical protein F2P81_016653 [Scophthalmus maximus]|uniref:Uncharacterized protein n=1 Tax=Scophthalmus maximus TaxID=52904 RepID=A0A6A4SIS0_SCOMX|nr:hypothetical protein F2P81_016653 [Scophthalmus maximus]